MTGGVVVNLGTCGRNFAAGMSGGVAYALDTDGHFETHCNTEMVHLEKVESDEDKTELKQLVENHLKYTDSALAESILQDWDNKVNAFVKVIPHDFKQMLSFIAKAKDSGLDEQEAIMQAFDESKLSKAEAGKN